jgi:hypothetical protein
MIPALHDYLKQLLIIYALDRIFHVVVNHFYESATPTLSLKFIIFGPNIGFGIGIDISQPHDLKNNS